MTDQAPTNSRDVLVSTFGNTFENLERVVGQLLAFLSTRGLPDATGNGVNLVVEEMVTNLVKYGYDDAGPHSIDLRVEVGPQAVAVVLEDDGHEFDPRSAPAPDTDRPLEARRPGGLGIALVRRFSSSMDYVRREGRNRLTVVVPRR
jgi:anti-sigma regulatory factor (Ser/Thr protein kinase)